MLEPTIIAVHMYATRSSKFYEKVGLCYSMTFMHTGIITIPPYKHTLIITKIQQKLLYLAGI